MKSRFTRRSLLGGAAAGAAILALPACSAGGEEGTSENPITFQFSLIDNEGTNYHQGAVKIAEEVEAATDGRIKINVIAGGALGDERSTVEMVMNGDLDIATAANAVLTNWIPEMSILDQAFLFDNAEQAHAAVDGAVGELIGAAAQGKGLHVIGYMESGFRNVFSSEPIAELSEFSGVKIRTMQNEYHMAAFESFGALPVAMPAGDQFTALQQGTIDAAENATSNMLANKFFEITKHHTTTEHAFVYILITMSDAAWSKIPEDLRPAFTEAVQRGYEAQREYLAEANEAAVSELKAEGVEFHEIDREALVSAYNDTAERKKFSFNPEWQAALDAVRDI